MGKPAARLGDTAMDCADPADTPTGTVIAAGTVLINGIPAAKQNDQIVGVDVHIVMIPSPGGPVPTPLPHPFAGMIDGETESTVKIMGQPAAVVGSTASAQPQHIPQGGPFQKPPANKSKISMGSPDVMIGSGSGSGSGSGGSGETAVKATSKGGEAKESHRLDVKFVDKGGKPVTGLKYDIKGPDGTQSSGALTGQVKRSGVPEGTHEISLTGITRAAWEKSEANIGDKVKLQVETVGIESGEKAGFEIFIKDGGFADRQFDSLEAEVKSGKIEAEWELKVDEKLLGDQKSKEGKKYSTPYYYFTVEVAGQKQRSGILRYQDWIELELKDEDGKPVAEAEYKLFLPNGAIKKGKLDKNGYAKVEKIPPGKVKVTYDVRKSSS